MLTIVKSGINEKYFQLSGLRIQKRGTLIQAILHAFLLYNIIQYPINLNSLLNITLINFRNIFMTSQ